jgi:hypothetical protein
MSISNFPKRAQIEQAGDLDFTSPRGAAMPITIELAPDGLHIRIEYDGVLGGIPAAIAKLEAAGLVELVQTYRAAAVAPAGAGQHKPKVERVTPEYDGAGEPCCPVHHKPLSQGRYGLYCSAKAKPAEAQNDKGYCSIRFSE